MNPVSPRGALKPSLLCLKEVSYGTNQRHEPRALAVTFEKHSQIPAAHGMHKSSLSKPRKELIEKLKWEIIQPPTPRSEWNHPSTKQIPFHIHRDRRRAELVGQLQSRRDSRLSSAPTILARAHKINAEDADLGADLTWLEAMLFKSPSLLAVLG